MKGYFQLTVSWILVAVLIIGVLVAVQFQINNEQNKQRKKLVLDSNDYFARQDLHQLMSTKVQYKGNDFVFADLLSIYQFDDSAYEDVRKVIKEYFGTGDVYKQNAYLKNDANLMVIAVLDKSALDMLKAANAASKEELEETDEDNKGKLFEANLLDKAAFRFVTTLFTEIQDNLEIRAKLWLNPEELLDDLELDQKYAVHSMNIAGLTGDKLTILLVKNAE